MVQIKVFREEKDGKPSMTVQGELEGKKHELMTELVMGVKDACEKLELSQEEKKALLGGMSLALLIF